MQKFYNQNVQNMQNMQNIQNIHNIQNIQNMQKNNLMREFENNLNMRKAQGMFPNNNMMNNNPYFSNFINNTSVQERINNAKIEQVRRAKNVKELGMNEQELISYVINPIKIEKMDKKNVGELLVKYDEQASMYNNINSFYKNNAVAIPVPKAIQELWDNRKNTPYKNILHFLDIKDYTNKKYTKEQDLIIHKTTQLEKAADIDILKKKLNKIQKMICNQNNELENIYTDKKKMKFLEKFEYENKNKNKINYDPKNCAELKEIYKNEQRKLNKQNKRIDDMIELLMSREDLSKEDIEEIQKMHDVELNIISQQNQSDDYNNNNDNNDSDNDNNNDNDSEGDKNINNNISNKYKNRKEEKDRDVKDFDDKNKKCDENKPKRKIMIVKKVEPVIVQCTDPNINLNIGTVSQEKVNKYRNR